LLNFNDFDCLLLAVLLTESSRFFFTAKTFILFAFPARFFKFIAILLKSSRIGPLLVVLLIFTFVALFDSQLGVNKLQVYLKKTAANPNQ